MPRLLALGHVTWDRLAEREVLGGSVTYAALAASRLGWEAAVLTSAGPDFDPPRDLPGIAVFREPSRATTRFHNTYGSDGGRRQILSARADAIDLGPLPDEWRNPDVLLLGGVAGELGPGTALAFEAGVVGANAQGWLRTFDAEGNVRAAEWRDPARDLEGVHVLFLSEHDLGEGPPARDLLAHVPVVAFTRGWRGLTLYTREGEQDVAALPRPEVDPTGAGDVFATGFLIGYHETNDLVQAAAFGACAASCVVEGVGASKLADRAELERRLEMRERLVEDGEWEE